MRTTKILAALMLVVVGAATWSACKKNVEGCTNPAALNYNPDASEDNGKCVFAGDTVDNTPIPGCTDPDADNYDPNATVDDSTCFYLGCTDPSADNYDPDAMQDDGSCIDARQKFAGDYTVNSDCGLPLILAQDQTMSFDTAGVDTVWIDPLTAVGGTVFGLVDGWNITIPPQTLALIEVQGSGSIDKNETTVTINYDYDAGLIGSGSCTAVYQK